MKFFYHFSFIELSNSYLIGPDQGGDAVLIDPGVFDLPLLELIEGNGLYVRQVLITHAHSAHVAGITTLLKIYDAEIYSFNPRVLEIPANQVKSGDCLELGEFCFEVLETPGHTSDSVTFKLGSYLFTGDTLTAGSIARTSTGYERVLLLNSIRSMLDKLADRMFIFPGHGPPTRVGIEKRLNPYLQEKF